jgi:hypothetical protein
MTNEYKLQFMTSNKVVTFVPVASVVFNIFLSGYIVTLIRTIRIVSIQRIRRNLPAYTIRGYSSSAALLLPSRLQIHSNEDKIFYQGRVGNTLYNYMLGVLYQSSDYYQVHSRLHNCCNLSIFFGI